MLRVRTQPRYTVGPNGVGESPKNHQSNHRGRSWWSLGKPPVYYRVSPWLSAVPPSSFPIDLVNRCFLLLRIADVVIDVGDVLGVSVPGMAAFPPGEHLAFEGIVSMQRQILVAVEEAFGTHQHSNEESNVWRSVTVQLV